MEQDFQWFKNNYAELSCRYPGKHIAIKGQRILGVYKSCVEAVRETEKREPLGTFIVQYCKGDESGYTGYVNGATV